MEDFGKGPSWVVEEVVHSQRMDAAEVDVVDAWPLQSQVGSAAIPD